jgi:hypothetical protein
VSFCFFVVVAVVVLVCMHAPFSALTVVVVFANDCSLPSETIDERWDIFDCPTVRRRQRSGGSDEDDDEEEEYCCNYLASTVNCAGRPTRDILRKIANEYRQHQPA